MVGRGVGGGNSPATSMLSPGSTLPEFGRTQYSWGGSSVSSRGRSYQRDSASNGSRTLGAVVLTLKATGCWLLFVIVRERLTRVVRGPVGGGGWSTWGGRSRRRRTPEAQSIARIEGDGHGGAGRKGWRDRGKIGRPTRGRAGHVVSSRNLIGTVGIPLRDDHSLLSARLLLHCTQGLYAHCSGSGVLQPTTLTLYTSSLTIASC